MLTHCLASPLRETDREGGERGGGIRERQSERETERDERDERDERGERCEGERER